MKKINIKLNKITEEDYILIINYFKQGKIVVYPTDTIYGLGCLATDKKAIEKIYRMKKRAKNKPLLILASSLSMLKKYCYVNKPRNDFLKKLWLENKKPVSAVLKSKKILPETLTAGQDSIAVRLPRNDFLIKIIKKIGAPIVSTSLNKSGKESKKDVGDLEKYFDREKPDLVVDSGILKGKPSKLVDIREMGN
ncbi:MAG: L-threonylcarbamoyladenylate synthase, partial [bacterium]|nr:L-threonylcarbamoyladenylate synthase [bacterium]